MRHQPNFSLYDDKEIKDLFNEFVAKPYSSRRAAGDILNVLSNTHPLQMWHDQSVISNHGHLLVTVNTLYDP